MVALKTLAAAILSFDWHPDRADIRDVWICHLLRREAEDLILSNLSEFLQGNYQPRSNDERLALLGICQFRGLHAAAARLYADAFAADPKLADDMNSRIRFGAACSASLAGSATITGTTDPGEAERRRWRKQALDWLRADLDSLARHALGTEPSNRELVKRILMNWQIEPALAMLRDPAALEKLSPSERQECQSFWRDLNTLLERTKARTARSGASGPGTSDSKM